jgi:hypothetical protein
MVPIDGTQIYSGETSLIFWFRETKASKVGSSR